MLYNIKAQYNIKDTVPIFNPNPIKEKERFFLNYRKMVGDRA